MIPSISQILDDLLGGSITKAQAEAMLDEHVRLAESAITVNLPAIDRLVDVLKEKA